VPVLVPRHHVGNTRICVHGSSARRGDRSGSTRLAHRFCQDRRDPRCQGRVLCFGDAAIQHHDLEWGEEDRTTREIRDAEVNVLSMCGDAGTRALVVQAEEARRFRMTFTRARLPLRCPIVGAPPAVILATGGKVPPPRRGSSRLRGSARRAQSVGLGERVLAWPVRPLLVRSHLIYIIEKITDL
jgi:hypothetical protein